MALAYVGVFLAAAVEGEAVFVAASVAIATGRLMSPFLFSALNLAGAFAWAGAILGLIAWAGPTALTRLGVGDRVALAAPVIIVVSLFLALRRVTLDRAGSAP